MVLHMLFPPILLTVMPNDDNQLSPGDHLRSIEVDRRTRTYLVHVPAKHDPKKPAPVVLVFHGGASNAQQMVHFCGLNETADEYGFIVVYPSGTGRLKSALTWNGGSCCGYAMQQNIDDVAFTRDLLDDLAKVVACDHKRVYATGMSNGAIMVYRLACELSDRIATIAPVAGPMETEIVNPKRVVSVIHFHGTEDEFAPFKGGKGAKSLTQAHFRSVDGTIRAWVKADGCSEEPTALELPDQARDGTRVTIKTYSGGKGGAEVVLVKIDGMGHTWPGKDPPLRVLGKTTHNVSANEMMWEFFQRHPMK
jgi:polyhydroxybutyrate depolymerase